MVVLMMEWREGRGRVLTGLITRPYYMNMTTALMAAAAVPLRGFGNARWKRKSTSCGQTSFLSLFFLAPLPLIFLAASTVQRMVSTSEQAEQPPSSFRQVSVMLPTYCLSIFGSLTCGSTATDICVCGFLRNMHGAVAVCVTRNVGPQPSAFGLGRATGIQMKKRKDCFSDPIIYITHKPASSPESEEKSAPQYCSTT